MDAGTVVLGILAWTGLFFLVRKVVRDRRARKTSTES